MSKRDERIKRMQAQQVKQAESAPEKSWFSDMFANYDKRLQDLPESNPLRQVPLATAPSQNTAPMLGDGSLPIPNPGYNIQEFANRLEPTPQGAMAPIKRQPIRNVVASQAAPSAYPTQAPERVPLAVRGTPLGQQRAPLSVHNIMDADAGANGYDW